jgi:hypothetical protein
MGTVAIIVFGVVAITIVSVLGDMVSKIVQARLKAREAAGNAPLRELEALESRLAALEARVEERDDSVRKLQDELSFVTRMLEDKTGGQTRP